MRMKVRTYFLVLFLPAVFLPWFAPCTVLGDQQELSVGYGLGILNNESDPGRLHSGDHYDYVQIAYGYEKTLSGKFNLLIEPFVAIDNRPQSGLDGGLTVNGRYYFGQANHAGLFVTVGAGGAYTSVGFKDQGTHGLFILQGGIGYKWQRLFVEWRFKHYSNGGLAWPNRSVNSTMANIGFAF